jgi:GH25 family lysozyme M1 (1,4-beta-N-acetylmuramidase)
VPYSYLIDISRWQGQVDHRAVERAGISGCVIKASEGLRANTAQATTQYFRQNAPVAKRTYRLWGAYHYLTPADPAGQVAWCLEQIQAGYGSLDGCVIQLDAEDHSGGPPVLSVEDVARWKQEWDKATNNYPVLLYAPRWYWTRVRDYGQLTALGFAGWWPSAYVDGYGDYLGLASKIRRAWDPWAGLTPVITQYTQSARISGINADVDVNEIRMGLDQFQALTTRQGDDMAQVPQEQWDRARAQLDAISDILDGGKGAAYQRSRLRADQGHMLTRIIEEIRAVATAVQTSATQDRERDDALYALVRSAIERTPAPIPPAEVDRIISEITTALDVDRERARQAAADAITAAVARLADAAAGDAVPPAV